MADSNLAIASLVVTAGIGQLIAEWTPAVDPTIQSALPNLQLGVYEVYVSSTSSFANAVKVGETTQTQYIIKGLAASVSRWVWVRARDKVPNTGEFTPLSTSAGRTATTSTILPPSNSITNDMLQDNSVDTNNLRTGAVSADKIDANAVTATKIAAGSITTPKLAADAVTADKISVTSLDAISAVLGNVVVNGSLIVNGSLVTGKAASEAWTIIRGAAAGNPVSAVFGTTQTVAQCIQPSQGKPIMVVGSCAVDGTSGTSAPYIEIALYRDATKLVAYRLRADNANRFRPAALVFCDANPPSGNITYKLTQLGVDSDSAAGQTSGHAIATFQGLR